VGWACFMHVQSRTAARIPRRSSPAGVHRRRVLLGSWHNPSSFDKGCAVGGGLVHDGGCNAVCAHGLLQACWDVILNVFTRTAACDHDACNQFNGRYARKYRQLS
jgi:hypothetical protein